MRVCAGGVGVAESGQKNRFTHKKELLLWNFEGCPPVQHTTIARFRGRLGGVMSIMSKLCGILGEWDLLIYLRGEFRVKLWSALSPPPPSALMLIY